MQVSFQDHQTDEQGWVGTILSATLNGTVRISTMDWLGQSQYADATIYWSAISTAISKVKEIQDTCNGEVLINNLHIYVTKLLILRTNKLTS